MKNKIIIVLIVLAVVIAALAGVYFFKQKNLQINPLENNQSQSKIITDKFSVDLPAGWQQVASATGTVAMAVKTNESVSDPEAQKINFNSYFAVSPDVLNGQSLSEYVQIVKSQLQQIIPGISFTKEQDMTISEKPAHAMEMELNQQGINFKVLMVMVSGQGDDVWVMSFNSTKSDWDGYQGTFYGIANSFVVKK